MRSEFEDVSVELIFDEDQAKVICTAKPEDEHWFEHFLIDLKKHVLSPSVKQLIVHKFGTGEIYLRFPLAFVPFDTGTVVSTPYCRIIIRQKPPSPFIENIKANLVSNVIWAVVVFILGGI